MHSFDELYRGTSVRLLRYASALARAYTALAREADAVVLAQPEAVRRRGDRRTGVRLAAAVTGAAVAVGAVATATGCGLAGGGPSPGPARSATAASPMSPSPGLTVSPTYTDPSPSPSGLPAMPPRTTPVASPIPDKAFLQQADTNGDIPIGDSVGYPVLPSLCGATYPSDSSVRARRTRHMLYWETPRTGSTGPDGTYLQTITMYRPGGGPAFMDELRRAVTACPIETREGWTYRSRLLAAPSRGDESVLVEVSHPMRDDFDNLTGGTNLRLVSVVRIGDVVMVLYEAGWERGWSADRAVVDRFTATAVSRLRAWLG